MKKSVLSMLIAGIFLAATAVGALAHMEKSETDQTSGSMSSDWGYSEREGPVETGNLPSGESLSTAHPGYTGEIRLFDGGGVPFRDNIDTQ